MPRPHLEAVGLKPERHRVYGLAYSGEVRQDVTAGDIKFMGEVFDGKIVYGESDAEPLLEVTALESAGIEVEAGN